MNKNLLTQKIFMLETLIIKIHELIHQNRVEEAEEILHKIILGDESGVNPKLYIANDAANKVSQFDFEFRKLCEKHKMISAYVAQIAQEQADGHRRIRDTKDNLLSMFNFTTQELASQAWEMLSEDVREWLKK